MIQVVEDTDFVHQLFAAATLDRLDSHVLYSLFLAPFVYYRVLAASYLLVDVIVIHI